MLRYVALVWDPLDREKAIAAATLVRRLRDRSVNEWLIAIDEPGICVVYDRPDDLCVDDAYILSDKRGVIFGRLFKRHQPVNDRACDDYTRVPNPLDSRQAHALISSRGKELISGYWGQYVAFLNSAGGVERFVVRDPSGGVPCQRTSILDIDVYFVRLEDLERIAPLRPTFNRQFLLGFLSYDLLNVRSTGIEGVETILAGECVVHGHAAKVSSFYWNPLQIATSQKIECPEAAAHLIRAEVRACVRSWASCFTDIMLELSGGLDSSILLSCLKQDEIRSQLVCLNYYTDAFHGDERSFAQLVARHCDCELVHRLASDNVRLDFLRVLPRALCPFACLSDPASEEDERNFVQARSIKAIFAGHGGDELFYRTPNVPTSVDYAWERGLGRTALSMALDEASRMRISLWKVLRPIAAYGVLHGKWDLRSVAPQDYRALMTPEAKLEASETASIWHPLFRDPSGVPPGKIFHAYSMTTHAAHLHVPYQSEDAPPGISPLCSQPLMEACLRIPVYIHTPRGHDRALVRTAFTGSLPKEIIERRSKASGTSRVQRMILHNLDLVKEFLLDGLLVQERIVDRKSLERVLHGDLSAQVMSTTTELIDYISVESWARSWLQSPMKAAA